MIKINNPDIDNIAKAYFDKIQNMSFRDSKFNNIFSANQKELIFCKPDDFNLFKSKYDTLIQNYKDRFKNYMVGQYERIIYDEGIGYWLANELKIDVCPYCNRQYTFTVNSKKKTRPQFDHFYSKSDYPYFALSFYNLIPSCSECNRIKGRDDIKFNPYVEDFGNCKFTLSKIERLIINPHDKTSWDVNFKNNSPSHDVHLNTFALKELYNGHKDYVSEIVVKALSYTPEYLLGLKDILQTDSCSELTDEEMRRLIFGNYINKNDFGKRTLSKLTADILEQLQIDVN